MSPKRSGLVGAPWGVSSKSGVSSALVSAETSTVSNTVFNTVSNTVFDEAVSTLPSALRTSQPLPKRWGRFGRERAQRPKALRQRVYQQHLDAPRRRRNHRF